MMVSPTEKSGSTGTSGNRGAGVRGEQTWMLVKVITYGALIILLDELENDGTVIERFFVQNLISDAVSIEFVLVVLNLSGNLRGSLRFRKILLDEEAKGLTDTSLLDAFHVHSSLCIWLIDKKDAPQCLIDIIIQLFFIKWQRGFLMKNAGRDIARIAQKRQMERDFAYTHGGKNAGNAFFRQKFAKTVDNCVCLMLY